MVGGYFITGTSTDVGKTFVTSLLLKAFRASGVAAVGYKPVACGSREDAKALRGACEGEVTLDEVNPLAYRVPAAPMAAVMIENVPLDWDAMLAGARVLRERFPMVLAEGVGGWKVPCTAQKTMADLAVEIGWPVIVVVDNRLGALNHTLLTLESIASHGLSCAGLILNQPEEERDAASISNTAVLSQLVEVPILAEIMYDQDELELPNELCG
jgi:dethiobiotin synthetase